MSALIIFIKNPEKGKVKTRLARTIGDEKALEIYQQLLKITRENTKELFLTEGVVPYLFYSDFKDKNDDWSNSIFKKHIQSGIDLGARMANAFKKILRKHEKVCIIGSDCPTLSTEVLKLAYKNLERNDFVIGPSTDGGYYLLGIKKEKNNFKFPINLFKDMLWSTADVLPETIKRISLFKKSYHLLPELTDIDEEQDWLAFQLKIKN
jgi:uncharacterized protein